MWETGGGFFRLSTITKVASAVSLLKEYCTIHGGPETILLTTKPSLESQCPLYWQLPLTLDAWNTCSVLLIFILQCSTSDPVVHWLC